MAAILTGSRTTTHAIGGDLDNDGAFDPSEIVTIRLRFTNTGQDPAKDVSITDSLNGLNNPTNIRVTPIAFDDTLNTIMGNTPVIISKAALLGNDQDPDGLESALTITGTSNVTGGTLADNGDGTFTFTPTTGFNGNATFQYTVTDAQGLASVSTGLVTIPISNFAWYVDSAYGGANGASDGSYLRPFTSFQPLNDDGTASGPGGADGMRGDDDVDGANNIIFVYNRGTAYTGGITLENGQQLYGDGHEFTINNISIGQAGQTTGPTVNYTTYGITLADGNTVRGLALNGTAAGAEGIRDGGTTVGTLFIDKTSIAGTGKALDIDQGGSLNVSLTSLSSSGSSSEGVHLQGVSGTFSAAAGTIDGSTGVGFLIGASGGATASSGGSVNVTYGGAITNSGTQSVEIQDRTGGAVTFNGAITDTAVANGATGIVIDTGAGFMTFNGQVALTATGTGNGVSITNNAGATVIFNAGGNGLDITTASGTGFNWVNGGDLNIGGSSNSITTATGVIFNGSNSTIGADKIFFDTLASTGSVAGTAISLSNISAPGTFNVTTTNIVGTTGAAADAININASSAAMTFGTTTIGATGDEGIELNGANGALTFTTVTMNGQAGNGVQITNATNSVTIAGGNLGTTNDAAGDAVQIVGGTGAVTIGANVSKGGSAGNVVEISGHSGGAIAFTGTINASGGVDNGIRIVNNTGGSITFSGSSKTLATSNFTAIEMTGNSNSTAVSFTNGGLDIDTGSGTAINATGTVGASSLTISGANNDVLAGTGRAIHIDGVTSNITLRRVDVTGDGTTTGVYLKDTGASGQFVVTGTGTTAGSGGTIKDIGSSTDGEHTTGTGIYMQNVSNVSLSNMIFGSSVAGQNLMANFGIRGEQVNNFTLKDSQFLGQFGNHESGITHESAIRFGQVLNNARSTGLTGTALFEGNNIAGGYMDNLTVFTETGTLNLTIKDSVTNQAVIGHSIRNDGVLLESGGSSNMTVNVTGVQFTGARGDMIQVAAAGATVQNITIANSEFNSTHANEISGSNGINIGAAGAGSNYNVTYALTNNTVKGTLGSAIHIYAGGQNGIMKGTIVNNTIGTPGNGYDGSGSLSGGDGITVRAERLDMAGTVTNLVRIEGNTIRDINDGLGAIRLTSNGFASGTNILEATIKNNTIAEVGTGLNSVFAGIYAVIGGNGGTDPGRMGLDISGNTVNLGTAAKAGNAVHLDQIFDATNARYYLPGYAGNQNGESHGGSASAGLSAFLSGKNTLTNGGQPGFPSGSTGAFDVRGVTGTALTQPVPIMAATPANNGWEIDNPLPEMEIAQPQVSTEDEAAPSGSAPDLPGGDGVTAGTGQGSAPAPVAVEDNVLSDAELDVIVEAAIQRWIDAGATPEQVAAMRAVDISVIDMVGIYLGNSSPGSIRIDSDGAGYGWFIDATPGEDGEFSGSGGVLKATAEGGAAGKLDLLTVVMHELGHQIGLEDVYQTGESDELMYGYVSPGERRLPEADDAAAADGTATAGSYALTPVAVGEVPAGKTFDVYFDATIAPQTNKLISNLSNTGTASYDHDNNSGTPNITATANENTVIDTLTLGNLVWLDADKDGVFDSGEGVQGVALTLFADTGSVAGELDSTDTQLATTTSLVGGAYTFTGLAPGEYIVRVDAANLTTGGALNGKITSAGSADPDDDVDGDDNGVAALNGSVASKAISLAYNTEPSNGVGNDTNNTLDFSFFAPNQAPVIGALNGDSGTFTENGSSVKIDAGGNATVTDGDSANFDGGSLTVAWNSQDGDTISFGAGTGLDGSNNVSVGATNIGVLTYGTGSFSIGLNSSANAANVQTLIRALGFSSAGDNPTAGTRTFTITLKDGDGNDGGAGSDTATATSTISVVAVNDAPSGAHNGDSVAHNGVLTFTASDFSTGMTDAENHGFAGVKITTLPGTGTIKLNGTAILAGATITKAQLDNNELTFEPAAGSGGTAPTFTFQVQDDGGTANSGVDLDPTPNTFTINIGQSNQAPVVDLNGTDGSGIDFASAYTEGGAEAAIADTDVLITEDPADDLVSATITITNSVAGDKLTVVGTLPGSIVIDGTSTATMVKLTGAGTAAEYEAAIKQITYSSTSDNPTVGGTNTARTITVTANDGALESAAATATVTVTGVNDSPDGSNLPFAVSEDAFRSLRASAFGFKDPDGNSTMGGVTINALNGLGDLYFDADGSGPGAPVPLASYPQTYTVAELNADKLKYKAPADANGNALATISFQVFDNAGQPNSLDPVANTLTVNVSPVNEAPDISTAAAVNATEQTAAAILTGVVVSDVDLDAKNGGNGDYAGSTLLVSGDIANNANDAFTLVAGANFTIDGTALKSGGLTFATFSTVDNKIQISFTSTETAATSALVDEVIQSVHYTNTSDAPPASVQIAYTFTDGSPGGGQGNGETNFDTESLVVNIAAVNDAPVATITPAVAAPVGDEFLVNTATVDEQSLPTITALPSGGFVVAWSDHSGEGGDSSGFAIKAQRFDASGAKVGDEILVNTTTLNHQGSATITALPSGGFVVSWIDQSGLDGDASPFGIKAQLFDASGAKVGGEILVNTQTQDTQEEPTITALSSGGFVVSWRDLSGQGDDASGFGVKAQIFDGSGTKVGDEFLVNTETGNTQEQPTITALPSGGFVVAWTDYSGAGGDADGAGIKAQMFDASGAKVGGEILVNTETAGTQEQPTITALLSGGFVVAWSDPSGQGGDASGYGVKAQLFDASGAKVGTEFLVNTTTQSDQFASTITALPSGGFVASWVDGSGQGGDASGWAVKGQMFDASGAKVGGEFLVNSTTADNQIQPTITMLPSGKFVVSWSDSSGQGGDASGLGIKARMFGLFGATEQTALDLKGSLSVADADSGNAQVTVTLSVQSGVLNVTAGDSLAVVSNNNSANVTITGTMAQINALLNTDPNSTVSFTSTGDNPPASTMLTLSVNDGGATGGGALTGSSSATIAIAAVDDAPVAQPDDVATPENQAVNGNLFANNGNGVDSDSDGPALSIAEVNGQAANVGTQITLATGAKLTVNADGSYSYDPNGKFNSLTDNSSGAVNTSAEDSFTYKLTNGNTATVTVTVNGVAGPGDRLAGNSQANTITGTPQADFFLVHQGGNDTVYGLAGADAFYFGAALTSGDVVDGGSDVDQLALQGDYSGAKAVTFGSITNVEQIALLAGNDTRFGDTAGNLYSYNVTTIDSNVAAGQQMQIDAVRLRAGENFTFNGSAETDGSFLIWAGKGSDNLTGGAGNDGFLFRGTGSWSSSDRVDGGAGNDQIGLRGNFTGANAIVFGAGQITGIETIAILSGNDTRFGPLVGDLSYQITSHDGNVAAGARMTIDAASLRAGETLTFDGSAETDGSFRIFGGRGNDVLIGGAGNDIIRGGAGGDTIYGGGGNDTFVFRSIEDSNSSGMDGIQDFSLGDIFDLSQIDAIAGTPENDAFTFIGSANFTQTAGELRFQSISGGGSIFKVQGDVDGDGAADFEFIYVAADNHPLTGADFLL